MRLKSSDGATVELGVVGYQFPAIDPEVEFDYDANWLVLDGSVRTAQGQVWSWTDPSLLTWEARELATWLRSVAENDGSVPVRDGSTLESWLEADDSGADPGFLNFTEPNLVFSVAARTDAMVQLRVHLSLEALPEPPIHGVGGFPLYSYFVTITLTPGDLLIAVGQWERELEPHPIKVPAAKRRWLNSRRPKTWQARPSRTPTRSQTERPDPS